MQLKVNDIVQIQTTVSDVEYIGLVGYVKEVTETTVTVSFYYAKAKGENAYVQDQTFLISQVYFVGKPNPELLPN